MSLTMEQSGSDDEIKLGSVQPREGVAEIRHQTLDGEEIRIGGFSPDPEDPNRQLATLFKHNPDTGEVTREYGKIHGRISEATHYVWEHKRGVSVVASVAVSVALGTLWARHRKTKS